MVLLPQMFFFVQFSKQVTVIYAINNSSVSLALYIYMSFSMGRETLFLQMFLQTCNFSVMAFNNAVGAIQPIMA